MKTIELRGIHVFWMIFAFFSVTIAVNALFIARAVTTFPGEQVANSYLQGVDFNREIARRRQQQQLGWTAQAGLLNNGATTLVVRMRRADAAPIRGLELSVSLRRPGDEAGTQTLLLAEEAPGVYSAPLALNRRGRFDIAINARRSADAEPVFVAEKSLVTP